MMLSAEDDISGRLCSWASEEIRYRPHHHDRNTSCSQPSLDDFRLLVRGPQSAADIWQYVTSHVFSSQTVKKVKGNLRLHSKSKQHQVMNYQVSPGRTPRKGLETEAWQIQQHKSLQQELAKHVRDMNHLKSDVQQLRKDIMTTEQAYQNRVRAEKEVKQKTCLLKMHSRLCNQNCAELQEYTRRLQQHLENTQSKPADKVLYYSRSNEKHGTDLETSCTHDVRKACENIDKFLHDILHGAFTNDRDKLPEEKAKLVSFVERILIGYPVMDILQALLLHTHTSVRSLRDHMVTINVKQDVERLKYKYEAGGELTDVSAPGSSSLSQSAHQHIEAEQRAHIVRFYDTEQHVNKTLKYQQHLQNTQQKIASKLKDMFDGKPRHQQQLKVIKALINKRIEFAYYNRGLGAYLQAAQTLRQAIEKATQDNRILAQKQEKIDNFSSLRANKQSQIQVLHSQNAESANLLIKQTDQIHAYISGCFMCAENDLTSLMDNLRDSGSTEAERFAALILASLMLAKHDEVHHRSSVNDLSIYSMNKAMNTAVGQTLSSVIASVNYDTFQAGDYLLLHCRDMKLDLMNTDLELQASNICGHQLLGDRADKVDVMMSHIADFSVHDEELMMQALPAMHQRITKMAQSLHNCMKTKDSIQAWKDQPGQKVVPWLKYNGLSLQQWLDQWTVLRIKLKDFSHYNV